MFFETGEILTSTYLLKGKFIRSRPPPSQHIYIGRPDLSSEMDNMDEKECCPRFDPKEWDDKVFEWKDRKFIKDKVSTVFHIPMNFGGVMKRSIEKIEQAQAKFIENMALSEHTSKWNMDVYLSVDKEVPGAENVTLSGKYLSKVYEGDFKETEKWCKDFKAYTEKKGSNVKKWYMWYTTCPKCAKKYGKNYVVIVGKVD